MSRTTGRTSGFVVALLPVCLRGGLPGKLGARAYAELAIHLGEVPGDGLGAQRQRLRDLLVRVPRGHERGDLRLGLR